MKLTQAVYSEDESLTEFLIRRQRNYRLSAGTFVFDTDQDAHWFNDKTKRITQLREQLGTLVQKEQETLRQTSAAR